MKITVTSLLTISLAISALPIHGSEVLNKEERNKAIALRVFEENFNQGRFQVADEIYAPDFKIHGLHGEADLKADQEAVHAEKHAFPDLKMTVSRMVAEGDFVAVHWIFRGTHTSGGYGGLPPTGTKIEMPGITIWRIVDGKIHDEWGSFDEMGAYLQVIAHVKWFLLAGFVAFLGGIILIERLLCMAVREIWIKFRG